MHHKVVRRRRAHIMIKNASRKLSKRHASIAATSINPALVVINKNRKIKIPAALREQVWIHNCGRRFESKCCVIWCANRINVFDFQCGHKHAEAEGGPTVLENLIPLCQRCNQSMGTMHYDEWVRYGCGKMTLWQKLRAWFH